LLILYPHRRHDDEADIVQIEGALQARVPLGISDERPAGVLPQTGTPNALKGALSLIPLARGERVTADGLSLVAAQTRNEDDLAEFGLWRAVANLFGPTVEPITQDKADPLRMPESVAEYSSAPLTQFTITENSQVVARDGQAERSTIVASNADTSVLSASGTQIAKLLGDAPNSTETPIEQSIPVAIDAGVIELAMVVPGAFANVGISAPELPFVEPSVRLTAEAANNIA
jgi:hypothetical protein